MALNSKLDKASMKLMLQYEFFSALCLRMRLIEDKNLKPATMATDGENIYYHPKFVEETGQDELVGVLAHEGLHMGLGHPFRREGRDPQLFNIACDLSINHILAEAGLKLPADAIKLDTIRKHLRGKVSEAIINQLPQMNAEKIYSYLEQAAEPGKIPCPNWGQVQDPSDLTPQNAQEKIAGAAEALQAAATQAERNKGDIPGSLKQLIDKLRKPRVDWKNVIWRFTQGDHPFDYSYKRANKMYVDDGLYLPTIEKIGIGSLAVFIDTSGSVGDHELEQFLGEINAISTLIRPSKIWVIPCDMVVHEKAIAVYEAGEEITVLDAAGRGGTSFKPPFEYIKKHDIVPDKIVYLTDLCGDFPPDPEIPTLWVSTVDGKAPFGDTVVIGNG